MKTELEKEIIEEAKKQIPRILEDIKNSIANSRYVQSAFMTGWIVNFIIYDKEISKFIEIRYPYEYEENMRSIDVTDILNDVSN